MVREDSGPREYGLATHQENPRAQCHLERMYGAGYGLAQSDTEAAQWHSKAAYQGNCSCFLALC